MTRTYEGLSLGDLGERAIIRDILVPRYRSQAVIGNDCAALRIPSGTGYMVATTDPCPTPAARLIGFKDLYYYGWLLATINLSDVAASGATPVGLLGSYNLPSELGVTEFLRILDGVDDCCAASGTCVIGGNLKEAEVVELQATAIGFCANEPLSREGARAGDSVFVLGELGDFWAGFLTVRLGLDVLKSPLDQVLHNVLTPLPKSRLGERLGEMSLASACLDNSDGLASSLWILAEASGVQIRVDLDAWEIGESALRCASELHVDPVRLCLGWGDWQLVAAVRPHNVELLAAVARECGVVAHRIGSVSSGRGVIATRHDAAGSLMHIDSERFAADSWFKAGIDDYLDRLLKSPLLLDV